MCRCVLEENQLRRAVKDLDYLGNEGSKILEICSNKKIIKGSYLSIYKIWLQIEDLKWLKIEPVLKRHDSASLCYINLSMAIPYVYKMRMNITLHCRGISHRVCLVMP
jgi:hypothetical protein